MKQKKFIYVGNRAYILEKMKSMNLNIIDIYAVKGSYLEEYLYCKKIDYKVLSSKETFIEDLQNADFDILISNGLPYILPISRLCQGQDKKFINIHPSYLPDLRGPHPITGALLFERDAGATCHYMNDKIDEGDMISQIKIEYSEDLDAGLLYQLSFFAEVQAFEEAYKRAFEISNIQHEKGNEIYYSFKKEDSIINLEKDTIRQIINKVRAFSLSSKPALFLKDGKKFRCLHAEVIYNKYVCSLIKQFQELDIVFSYEKTLVIKKQGKFLKLQFEEIKE